VDKLEARERPEREMLLNAEPRSLSARSIQPPGRKGGIARAPGVLEPWIREQEVVRRLG